MEGVKQPKPTNQNAKMTTATITTVRNLSGNTFSIGDRVRHASDDYLGTIYGFNVTRRCTYVLVNPDSVDDVPRHDQWPLRVPVDGKSDFCRPRDHGLSMGNWIVIDDAAQEEADAWAEIVRLEQEAQEEAAEAEKWDRFDIV